MFRTLFGSCLVNDSSSKLSKVQNCITSWPFPSLRGRVCLKRRDPIFLLSGHGAAADCSVPSVLPLSLSLSLPITTVARARLRSQVEKMLLSPSFLPLRSSLSFLCRVWIFTDQKKSAQKGCVKLMPDTRFMQKENLLRRVFATFTL